MKQGMMAYVATAAALLGCGGKTPPPASDAADAAPTAACPAEPTGSCGLDGVVCEYGSDPAPVCNMLFDCSGGVLKPHAHAGGPCPTADAGLSPACPAYPPPSTPEPFDGGAACAVGTLCDYPEGRCQCAVLHPTDDVAFSCVMPGAGCPVDRPRLGTPCTQPEQSCTYEACGVSADFGGVTCSKGVWTLDDGIGCPG